MLEVEDSCLATQLTRQRLDLLRVATGEDRTMSAPHRFARDQFAGVSVRAVEEPGHIAIVRVSFLWRIGALACPYFVASAGQARRLSSTGRRIGGAEGSSCHDDSRWKCDDAPRSEER